MARFVPHIGLRTVKTGLAVALALFFADLRSSPLPIFAAIGAIVAMSRTVGDAFETCRTQFFGILFGAAPAGGEGTDPEFSAGNSVLSMGIDRGLLAQGRNFSLGVKINL